MQHDAWQRARDTTVRDTHLREIEADAGLHTQRGVAVHDAWRERQSEAELLCRRTTAQRHTQLCGARSDALGQRLP